MKRIDVDPPVSEVRRDRVEHQVFAQLAAARIADRADAVVPPPPRRTRGTLALAFVAVAAAAVAIFVIARGNEHERPEIAAGPSRVVTQPGQSSRFEVGEDAIVDAGSDTSVEVQRTPDGGVTLVLARGSVDCDVAPRAGRAPFRVIAGEVAVEVVGTRFTVTRTPSPRVDVARGKVRVSAPGGTWLVTAGESWTPASQTASEPPPPPPAADEEISIDTPQPARHVVTPEEAFNSAHRLLRTDPPKAARAFRTIADGKDKWAALALFDLATYHQARDPANALEDLDEYARRFPHGANLEDVYYERIEILRTMGRTDDARHATEEYLTRYPDGNYAKIVAPHR